MSTLATFLTGLFVGVVAGMFISALLKSGGDGR